MFITTDMLLGLLTQAAETIACLGYAWLIWSVIVAALTPFDVLADVMSSGNTAAKVFFCVPLTFLFVLNAVAEGIARVVCRKTDCTEGVEASVPDKEG